MANDPYQTWGICVPKEFVDDSYTVSRFPAEYCIYGLPQLRFLRHQQMGWKIVQSASERRLSPQSWNASAACRLGTDIPAMTPYSMFFFLASFSRRPVMFSAPLLFHHYSSRIPTGVEELSRCPHRSSGRLHGWLAKPLRPLCELMPLHLDFPQSADHSRLLLKYSHA